VACTIGLPRVDDDVLRIKEVATKPRRELFEGRHLHIAPLILSAYRDLSTLKRAAAQAAVLIVDSLASEQLLALLRDGKLAAALAIIVDWTDGS
jgi:hypothetical protein